MTPLDLIVGKLQDAGCDPKSQGPSKWESRCPAHRGTRRNLSVTVGGNGAVLLHCHHNGENGNPSCSAADIVAALGLTMADLYPGDPVAVIGSGGSGRNGDSPAPKTKSSGKRSWPTPEDALRAVARKIEPQPTKTHHWIYCDAQTKHVMSVVRFDAADGTKTYRPFHVQPDGTWAIGDPPGLLPLYALPWIESASEIYVTEGEKCAHAIIDLDFDLVATTSAHGAKSPDRTDWSPLAGKDVVILPDHDAAGEGYAASVLRLLKRLDPRPRVKVVRPPGLSDGEDVADWIATIAGPNPTDQAKAAARSELERLCQATAPVDLDTIDDAAGAGARGGHAAPRVVVNAPFPIPEWPTPPSDAAYHGLAGDVVRLIEPTTEADPVGMLLQFLIGFSNAVGPGLSFVAGGHHHHANEYGVMVGATSRGAKGTSWRDVCRFLVHADPDWANKRITHGLSSGEGLVYEIRDPVMGTDKKTGQPIVTDPGESDKRVLVVEQEFGNILRVIAREGNTLSALLRLGWDGDNLRFMTKNNPIRSTNPHVSLIGHITQQELMKYLSEVEVFNGLGNRILWACVKRSKELAIPDPIDARDLLALGGHLVAAVDHARTVGTMTWTPAGRALWEGEYGRLTEDRPGLWGAITSRAEAHVLRLSMIYAALDRSRDVADTHVHAALELWRFCDRSAAHLFGGSVGDKDADAILAALRAAPGGLTRTDISAGVFHRNRTADDITRALDLLQRYRLVRSEGKPERLVRQPLRQYGYEFDEFYELTTAV